jgi:hypothetical protein
MEHSLFKEHIGEKELSAYLQDTPWGDFYFPRFFPFRYTPFLKYETLIGSKGRSVMADVTAYNTSAPEKKRKIVTKLQGEIPSIRVSRSMDEIKLKEYNILQSQAGAPYQALLDLVFDDVSFVTEACLARAEWLALQAMSQGYISLTTSNNAGIITTTNVDFGMAAANKRVLKTATATRVWNNGTAANYTPITDIQALVNDAKSSGLKFKYLIMNYTNWLYFIASTEVMNQVWPYVGPNSVVSSTSVPLPALDQVNAYMRARMLPEIVVLDQSLTFEADGTHTQTNTDPWITKYVLFVPDLSIGETLYTPSAEELNKPSQVMQAKKGPILVSKWSDVNPVAEYTKGELNAFPSWPAIDSCWRLNTQLYAADGLDD